MHDHFAMLNVPKDYQFSEYFQNIVLSKCSSILFRSDKGTNKNPFSMLQSMSQLARKEYHEVSIVLGRILVCMPHSADCERLFLLYNKIKPTCRSSLQRQTISDYHYININTPQRCDSDPRPVTSRWMEEKDRRTRECAKVGKQECFTKVFAYKDTEEKEVR